MKEKSYCDRYNISFPYIDQSYDTYEGEVLKKELLAYGDYKDRFPSRRDLFEILAPASVDTFKQAVYGGADAIYFGYGEFNARANGNNFTSIKEVVDFCHFYNVKAYLAINISFYNSELSEVTTIIKQAEDAGIDAFIISDLALVPIIREYSSACIHASTQMGVHNRWGMEFLDEMEIDRAILSREVNLDNIRDITEDARIEIEVFVHGAICSGFSGACLLSSMLTGNSGNRGRCNQLCRQFYTCYFNGKKTSKGYLLSAKDMNVSKYIEKLIEYGVDSAKIEGRLKRAEYIGGITSYYSEIKRGKCNSLNNDDIKKLFNRGDYTSGYFENNDIIYPMLPNHMGIYAGKIVCVSNDGLTGYVLAKYPLIKENGYKVLRNYVEVGGAVATGECINGFYLVKANQRLKQGDVIRLTSDKMLADRIINLKKRKNIPIAIKIESGKYPTCIMNIKGNRYKYEATFIAARALNQPITEDELISLFEGSKVREIKFIVTDIMVDSAFLTKAQINQFRREAIDNIWKYLLGYYKHSRPVFRRDVLPRYISRRFDGDYAEVDTLQKGHLVKNKFNFIVYNPYVFDYNECKEFYEAFKTEDNLIFIKLPIYIPTDKEKFFEGLIELFDGVVGNNVGAVYIAHKMKKFIVCGQNMNVTNTKNWLIKNTNQTILSPEINYKEIKKFNKPLVYAYGYLPLMYLNFCPRKNNCGNCGACDGDIVFKDAKGEYKITTQKFDGYCEHTMHNGIITDIGSKYKVYKYFDFTLSSKDEILATLKNYYELEEYKPENTNKLHLTRGVL